ncbi:MAG: cob(I)alamin adenolsyltransferase [Syntrophus sp. (in: bacteria)]|nr:cob(I)alamin adenolsyltransferase [Syntrophus sp. (in: bacteria)]
MSQKDRILLFTGDGKGKTTAALGMALRASGHGMRVFILQFIKNDLTTGEKAACSYLPGVEIHQSGLGFVPEPSHPSFPEHRRKAEVGLNRAWEALESGEYSMVILDEVCTAVALHLLDEKAVIEALKKRHAGTHVVMTGRSATPGLINMADTVTEMCLIKHGFAEGQGAQKGVEY